MMDLELHWIGQNYQAIVTQRGRGLNELEVLELLRDCTAQLRTLHEQGLVHGNISWETLRLSDTGQCLLDPSPELAQGSNPRQDLRDLAIAAIQILTGKTEAYLTNDAGDLDWEDECVVSDQVADVLTEMLKLERPGPPAFQNAMAVSGFLNTLGSAPEPTFDSAADTLISVLPTTTPAPAATTPIAPPTPASYPAPSAESNGAWTPEDTGPTNRPPVARNSSGLLVLGFLALGLLGSVGLIAPSFLSQSGRASESEAKQYVGSMNRAQQAYYLENSDFSQEMGSLGLGISQQTTNYDYDIYQPHPYLVVNTGTPRHKQLRAFTGFVFLVDQDDGARLTTAMLCETLKPTQSTPVNLEISNNGYTVQCPEGMKNVDGGQRPLDLGGRIVTPDTDRPAQLSPVTPLGTPRPLSTPTPIANPFDNEFFPKPVCGDPLPTDPAEFPVSLYPVYVNPGSRNLQVVTSRFCRDAYEMTKKDTGDRAIQVASFRSQRQAQFFAEFLENQVGSGEVGPPTVIEFSRP